MGEFLCKDCGNIDNFYNYSIGINAGKPVYKQKGYTLSCSKCKSRELEFLEEEGEYNVNIGKFRGMSNKEKKETLKKRSKNHFNSKLKERKDYLDKNFTGHTKDVDFKQ